MHSYLSQFIDEFHTLGIKDIVLSPGARSTPLAMLICAHSFNVYMHVDERSAAFFALGIAKKSQRPVILLCTSGSAPAHYLPAIIEAKHSRVPLIILSADRPPELQHVGAPQTIIQKNLFPEFIKHFEELAIINEHTPQKYPRNVAQKAYIHAVSTPQAPVHINVPLRDPLVVNEYNMSKSAFKKGRAKNTFSFIQAYCADSAHDSYSDDYTYSSRFMKTDQNFHQLALTLNNRKGIIICGAGIKKEEHKEIIALSKHLKAPILADPLSNLRNYSHKNIIDSYDAFLKSDTIKDKLKPDYALLFGQAPVSKRVFQFLSRFSDIEVIQIDVCPEYRNPSLTSTALLCMSPTFFVRARMNFEKNTDNTYQKKWLEEQERMREILNSSYNNKIAISDKTADKTTEKSAENTLNNQLFDDNFFEGTIIQSLQKLLPKNSNLAIANSMSIRDIDFFWEKNTQNIQFFCNRGANGIDGTISTALGISSQSKEKTVLVTGDLAFFHDVNALLLAKKHALNLTIILINNNGGGIFQYLPQEQISNYSFLFETSHDLDFSALINLFNINYTKTPSLNSFETEFIQALHKDGVQILEIPINQQKSKTLHTQFTTPHFS